MNLLFEMHPGHQPANSIANTYIWYAEKRCFTAEQILPPNVEQELNNIPDIQEGLGF